MQIFASALVLLCAMQPVAAQPSPGKAMALSVLLPGLGHHYANEGRWRGAASFFVLVEVGLWLGVADSHWQRSQTVQSYRTYAATYADAQLEGKDRSFLVTIGTYVSSDAYREDMLRKRRWDQVGYVDDPLYQWHWDSEENMVIYQGLRAAADTWGQRRTVFIATLAANRALAALSALRSARRHRAPQVSFGFAGPGQGPVIQVVMQL